MNLKIIIEDNRRLLSVLNGRDPAQVAQTIFDNPSLTRGLRQSIYYLEALPQVQDNKNSTFQGGDKQ